MPGLRKCLEYIREREKEFVLFNVSHSGRLPARVETFFETQNVQISSEQTASGAPANVAVLSSDREVLAVVDVSTLRGLLERVPSSPSGVGIRDAEYEQILGHLKETTFTSYDHGQLLATSREIEDRARRVGRGTIHAGFQRFSNMPAQETVYADLADRGLHVHAYGVPDVETPDFGPAQIHAVEADEIEATWFVVFDGGGNDIQKSALLAGKQDGGGFYGTWTYDPGIVGPLLDYLERTYVSVDKGDQLSSET